MRLEPWQVMIGLAVVLVVVGAVASLGTFSPGQIVVYLVLLAGIVVSMVFGYRLGNVLADRRE